MQSNTFSKIITALLFLAIGIIVGILLPSPRSVDEITTQQQLVDNASQNQVATPDNSECVGEFCDTTTLEGMLVEVPVDYDFDTDQVVFESFQVSKSPAVLTAVLRQLFNQQSYQGSWNGYTFESVSIDADGVARLDLSGSHFPVGDMSMLYFKKYIEAAVFQYNTVNTLAVYIDGKVFDFCVDDQSDGEGPCPETPQYWIVRKN
ncbi:hypothetical protein H6776_03030 [Candidatus Nomurabacteria bacterium]|nr:hypothetical protein [Candidatus Nomurabacteria bacterium]